MNKNEKELEEISTTDKVKAFKALKDAGLRVEYNGSGVPTVICATADDIVKDLKNVRKLLKDIRYIGSFGVRVQRKDEMIAADDSSEDSDNSAMGNAEESEALTA